VYAESDFPERFTQPGDRWLQKNNGKPVLVRITSGRYLEGKNQYLVKLAGIDHRDQAEDLRQAQLLVPESDRLSLAPGEFHVSDLIGLSVLLHSDQSILGRVTNVFTMGHDMLEVTIMTPNNASEKAASNVTSVTIEAPASIQPNPPPSSTASIENALLHASTRAKAVQKLKLKAKKKNRPQKSKTLLIPFVEEIVPVVDVAAGRIEITPPPGLLDL
jgi:16S rRNA processing protein RimM